MTPKANFRVALPWGLAHSEPTLITRDAEVQARIVRYWEGRLGLLVAAQLRRRPWYDLAFPLAGIGGPRVGLRGARRKLAVKGHTSKLVLRLAYAFTSEGPRCLLAFLHDSLNLRSVAPEKIQKQGDLWVFEMRSDVSPVPSAADCYLDVAPPDTFEARNAARVPAETQAALTSNAGRSEASVRDVSVGGMLLALSGAQGPGDGEAVRVAIPLLRGETARILQLHAIVAWAEIEDDGQATAVGLRLVFGPDDPKEADWRQFVSERSDAG